MCGGLNDHININKKGCDKTDKKKNNLLKKKIKDLELSCKILQEMYEKEHDMRRINEAKIQAFYMLSK